MKSETRNDAADSYATLKTSHVSQPNLYKAQEYLKPAKAKKK